VQMSEKLKELGLVEINGIISYPLDEEVENV
jgi:hypothetical protein